MEGYEQIGMPRAKSIGSALGGWSRRRLLALLLLAAVLVCHGFFGASHQIHQTSNADTLPVAGHASHAGMQEADEGRFTGVSHSDLGLDAMAYAAVLLALSLGALLWLLGSARARIAILVRPPAGGRFPRLVPHPARGPTPAVLQVFRL